MTLGIRREVLELHHRQAGDGLEVAQIAGSYAVAEFQGLLLRSADRQAEAALLSHGSHHHAFGGR